jgi:hypothetical protein
MGGNSSKTITISTYFTPISDGIKVNFSHPLGVTVLVEFAEHRRGERWVVDAGRISRRSPSEADDGVDIPCSLGVAGRSSLRWIGVHVFRLASL